MNYITMAASSLGVKAVDITYKVYSDKKYAVKGLHESLESRPDLTNLSELSDWIHCMHKDNYGVGAIAYRDAIFCAIQQNNLEALEYLWSGIYYHDRDNPDYSDDLFTAARYGNITTWLHVLYAHENYAVLDPNSPVDFERLKKRARKNPEVSKWLQDNDAAIQKYIEETDSSSSEYYSGIHPQ